MQYQHQVYGIRGEQVACSLRRLCNQHAHRLRDQVLLHERTHCCIRAHQQHLSVGECLAGRIADAVARARSRKRYAKPELRSHALFAGHADRATHQFR